MSPSSSQLPRVKSDRQDHSGEGLCRVRVLLMEGTSGILGGTIPLWGGALLHGKETSLPFSSGNKSQHDNHTHFQMCPSPQEERAT